jgi:anti-sigma factor RsiW
MSVSCFTMSDRLHQYVDGELSKAERVEVEGHLEACGRCREVRGRLEALQAVLRREMVDPAPEAALAATVDALTGLDAVRAVDSVLRVEDLGRKGAAS